MRGRLLVGLLVFASLAYASLVSADERGDDGDHHQQLNDGEALLVEAVHVPTSPFRSPRAA